MSQELFYTSAPRGLKPGSNGFCTVACTRGMSANLMQQLELLSAYRHVFLPQDPQAPLNPVTYSHLVLSIAGRRCHVLSRICDAGLDHTHRTNKFAHHVVLDPAELPPGGPAFLLALPGFLRKGWQGEPANLPTGPAVPQMPSPPRPCHAWQQLAGDAGWAGVLAETASANRQAVLIFRPRMNLLPLLVEAMALLPVELRWRVSLSSYFTKLPAGVACQWRCVVEGTPEAAAARSAAKSTLLLDLCRPLGAAGGGIYADAARTGRSPAMGRGAALPASVQAMQPDDEELGRLLAGVVEPLAAAQPTRRAAAVSAADDYALAPPPVASWMELPPPVHQPQPKSPSRLPWILAAAILLVTVIGGGIAFSLAMRDASQAQIMVAAVNENLRKKEAKAAEDARTANEAEAKAVAEADRMTQEAKAEAAAKEAESRKIQAAEQERTARELAAKAAEERERKANEKKEEEKKRERAAAKAAAASAKPEDLVLSHPLPERAGGVMNRENETIAIVAGDWSEVNSMRLVGGHQLFGNGVKMELAKGTNGGVDVPWICVLNHSDGVASERSRTAKFTPTSKDITFRWFEDQPPKDIDPDRLRNCVLLIDKDGKRSVIRLRAPQRIIPIKIDFNRDELAIDKLPGCPDKKDISLGVAVMPGKSRKTFEQAGTSVVIDKCVKIRFEFLDSKVRFSWSVLLPDGELASTRFLEQRAKKIRDHNDKLKGIGNRLQVLSRQIVQANRSSIPGNQEYNDNLKNTIVIPAQREIEKLKERKAEVERTPLPFENIMALREEISREFMFAIQVTVSVKDETDGREYVVVLVEAKS